MHLNNNDVSWIRRLEICIGAARGLAYLHNPNPAAGSQQRILHRDIKSANILLDENWNARVADFGLSKFGPANQDITFIVSNNIAGTIGYCDPQYLHTGILTKESDVYSFGVVLFEVLCGRMCILKDDKNLGFIKFVKKCYYEQNLSEIIWGDIKNEIHPSSLDVFSTIAYRCLNRIRGERPSINEVVTKLETALEYQSTINKKPFFMKEFSHLRLELEFVRHATNNFGRANLVEEGEFETLYMGEFFHSDVRTMGAVKRFQHSKNQSDVLFWAELLLHSSNRHENLISLHGFCEESEEKIIVYEYASNRDLDFHLDNRRLTWIQRLKICLGAAYGLEYLHNRKGNHESIMHGYIRSGNILLDDKWNAKIIGYGLSKYTDDPPNYDPTETLRAVSFDVTFDYYDPYYLHTGSLTKQSEVYSFGVVLFEVLCSRRCTEDTSYYNRPISLVKLVQNFRNTKQIDTIINVNLRQQIEQNCLDSFVTLAYQCLEWDPSIRPPMDLVVSKLATALEYQVCFLSTHLFLFIIILIYFPLQFVEN